MDLDNLEKDEWLPFVYINVIRGKGLYMELYLKKVSGSDVTEPLYYEVGYLKTLSNYFDSFEKLGKLNGIMTYTVSTYLKNNCYK